MEGNVDYTWMGGRINIWIVELTDLHMDVWDV